MSHTPSPCSLYWTVRKAIVQWAVEGSTERAMYWAVHRAVNWSVHRAVHGSVDGSVVMAVRNHPLHPNLERFISELHQFQGGATWGSS